MTSTLFAFIAYVVTLVAVCAFFAVASERDDITPEVDD